MVSLKVDLMERRISHIKEEDCEWVPVPFAQDSACRKWDDGQGGTCNFKEEESERQAAGVKVEPSDYFSVSLEMQKHKQVHVFKEDTPSENDASSQTCPALQSKTTWLGSRRRRRCLSQLRLKPESLKFEDKFSVWEQQPEISGLQETTSFYQSSFSQTSPLHTSEQKQYGENIWMSPSGSETLIPVDLQCHSFHERNSPNSEDACAHQQVQNTNPLASYICQECGKNFKSKFDYNDHQQAHMEEKLHCCSECNKQLSCMSSLQKTP
ncbi:zinc finger protein 613-like isoform X2 [Erpetoichthys calabaricus]|uniref:zinc finger protein 613-like isoform X2 n=1 Tax=Erpetoichthys calabaricus TaxID=27687 RepID=UPI0022343A0D|nr:zinc finger protein 613-like isoform X2 [Erpetoichthys calabaricus]